LADRAIGFVLSRLAVVVRKEVLIDTHTTIMAVFEVFSSPDAAKAAVGAVIRMFLV